MNRRMKLKILMVFPLVLEIVALFFLPQQIPIHYNYSFQPDGYGSKYTILLVGIFVILFGLFMNWLYATNRGTAQEGMIYKLCMVALVIPNVINILFLYKSMTAGITYSIIGGADGPMAIFIAGSVGNGVPLAVLLGVSAILIMIGIIKFVKKD